MYQQRRHIPSPHSEACLTLRMSLLWNQDQEWNRWPGSRESLTMLKCCQTGLPEHCRWAMLGHHPGTLLELREWSTFKYFLSSVVLRYFTWLLPYSLPLHFKKKGRYCTFLLHYTFIFRQKRNYIPPISSLLWNTMRSHVLNFPTVCVVKIGPPWTAATLTVTQYYNV